jgi:WD40 repeat protein
MKYTAFISYKHSKTNTKKAEALEIALKKYAKPLLKPPIKIFRDEKEIRPGDDLKSTIIKALINSEYLIYLATKEAAESPWVQKEIKFWCDDLKRINKLIIIHIDDDIFIDPVKECIVWNKTNALPEILKNHIESIPVYANLTWAVKDKDIDLANIEFKKIINGIIAQFRRITPGEMIDEQILIHHRNIRLKNFALFLLFIFSIMSLSSAWLAWKQKKRADEKAIEALQQKSIAEEQTRKSVLEKQRADKQTKEAVRQKTIAEKQRQEAIFERHRADRKNKESIANGLSTIASLALTSDNIISIRIAEMAYKMSLPNPSPRVLQALSAAASSTVVRPLYILDLHHEKPINSAVFSPDGALILTASLDHTAKLWNLEGKLLVEFKHTNSVDSAVFSPDSTKILTACFDKKAILWDIKGACLEKYEHMGPVTSAIFSPDGRTILTASADRTARLWNLKGTCLSKYKHEGYINSVEFSIDGTLIITASNDGTSRLWDINGKCIAKYKHETSVNSAVFSPDCKHILTTASRENLATLWDLNEKKLMEFKTEVFGKFDSNSFTSAVFSPKGNYILTASTDKTAILWNIKGGMIKTFRHTDDVNSAVFSPDGTRILTASKDKTAKLWDLEGNPIADFTNHIDYVRKAIFSPDGKYILTSSYDNTAKLWKPDGTFSIGFQKEHEYVTSATFSPIGTHILTISKDYSTKKINTNASNECSTAKLWEIDGTFLMEYKNIGCIESAIFSPDGKKILTTSWIGKRSVYPNSKGDNFRLWDLKEKLLAENKNQGEINDIIFSPKGNFILTVSNYKIAYLWNLEGKLLTEYKHPSELDSIQSAFFSPEGNYILTNDFSGFYLWDIKGKLLKSYEDDFNVKTPIFSPDGKLILIISEMRNEAGEDDSYKYFTSTIKLRDLKGRLILECKPPYPSSIHYASFSPDGKYILALLNDYNVYLWDLKGNLLVEFKNKIDINQDRSDFLGFDPSFSPDGKYILTDSPDGGLIRLWNLNGILLAEYRLKGDPISVVFSPNNQYIFVQKYGTAELLYTPEGIIDWLKTAKIRELSQEDKKELGI